MWPQRGGDGAATRDGGGGGGGGGGGERRERLLEQPVDANRARAAPACVLVAVLREVVAGLRVGPVHHHGNNNTAGPK